MSEEAKIRIVKDGPYLVTGGVRLSQEIVENVGSHNEYRPGRELPQSEEYALCRCGHSKNMPFCDGRHKAVGFDGTEVAGNIPYNDRIKVFEGPTLDLYDDGRCAFARFCHRKDGDVWTLTEKSDDERLRDEAIQASVDCPAGRLTHRDKRKDNAPVEAEFPVKELVLLEDPEKECSAPIFAKGGIKLESADGFTYELRNRYALCRCGGSQNKPFCDAMHVRIGFDDHISQES